MTKLLFRLGEFLGPLLDFLFEGLIQVTELGSDRRQITIAMDDLDADCKEFAGRRMNQAVNRALSGKTIDSVEETIQSLHAIPKPVSPKEKA